MTSESYALALAAGGARGAYQAGAMLQLAEQGLRFEAVAGTGIGSLNAAYYAQGDGSVDHMRNLVELWRTLPEAGMIQLNDEAVEAAFQLVFSPSNAFAASKLKDLAGGDLTILDPEPMAQLLDEWLDYDAICASKTELAIAVLPETAPLLDLVGGTWRKAVYLRARELGPSALREALLAAGAIPLLLPSQTIGDRKYAHAAIADALPAHYLYQSGSRRIFSIFLSDRTPQNRADFPDSIVFQIRPSIDVNERLMSTFDFTLSSINRLIELGYKDAYISYNDARTLIEEWERMRTGGERIEALADLLPDRRSRRLSEPSETENKDQ